MQNIFTYLKVLALSAIIVSGIAIYTFGMLRLIIEIWEWCYFFLNYINFLFLPIIYQDKLQLQSITGGNNNTLSSSLYSSSSMVNDLWEEDGKKFDSSKCNSMYSLAIYSGLFAFGGWFVIGFIFNFHIIDLSFYFFFSKKN